MNIKHLTTRLRHLISVTARLLTNPKVILYLTITIFLSKTIYFLATHPQIQYLEDFPAHIARAYHTSLPWTGGWDTTYWSGYPLLLYPPLSHLLLKATLLLIPSQYTSLSILILVFFLTTLHSLYRFISSNLTNHKFRAWVFLLTLVAFLYLPRTVLGSFLGTLEVGGFSAALALPFFLYFLATDSWIAQGLLFGLLLLTHTFTAAAAGIIFGVRFLTRLSTLVVKLIHHQNFQRDFIFLKTQVYSLLLATIIGLPWIMPFLDPAFQSIAINLSINYQTTFFATLLLFISTLLIARQVKHLTHPYVISTAIFVLLAVSFFIPQSQLEVFGIHGLHFYRFYLFFFLLIPTTITLLLTTSKKPPLTLNLSTSTQALILILLFGSLYLSPFSHLPSSLDLNFSSVQSLSGRAINEINAPDLGPFPHAMQHLVSENTSLTNAVGYFYESSPISFFYKTITQTINPYSLSMGRVSEFYGAPLNTQAKIDQAINLLGINYLIKSSNMLTSIPDKHYWIIGEFYDYKNFIKSYYYLTPVSNNNQVESLNYLPKTDPSINLANWWRDTDHTQLVTKEDYPLPESVNTASVSASITHLSPTSISLNIDTTSPTPIFLKYTYSPYWQAEPDDSTSSTTQPVWITPGYMFLIGSGNITLTWQTPSYMKTFAPLGFATAIITALYLLLVRFRFLPPPSSKY